MLSSVLIKIRTLLAEKFEHYRIVILWTIAAGVLVPVYFLRINDISYLAWDFRAYHVAGRAALSGEQFVGASPELPGVSYVYPPIAILLFLPQSMIDNWRIGFVLQTVLNVTVSVSIALLVIRLIENHRGQLPRLDRYLIMGFFIGSPPVAAIFGQGQVDVLIALAFAVVFVSLERGNQILAGVALAGAALVKVFPAVLVFWLLWRRAWYAFISTVATGIGGLVIGAILFGLDAYRQYIGILGARSRVAEFAGTVSPDFFAMSLHRPLSQLLPGIDPHLYAPISAVLLAPAMWVIARHDQTASDRLATYLAAIIGVLLVSPASNSLYVVYVYFPLFGLLFLNSVRRLQSVLLVCTIAIAVPVQPEQLHVATTILGVPSAISNPALNLIQSILTIASVPLLGLVGLFLWCILQAVQRSRFESNYCAKLGIDKPARHMKQD